MIEFIIDKNKHAIVALEAKDVQNCSTIRILKNGVMKCEYPADIIKKLGIFWFPDTPIIFDINKDKITIERL